MSGILIFKIGAKAPPPRNPPVTKPKPGAFLLFLLVSGLWSVQAYADIVDLGGKDRLSGRVTAINAEGRVTVVSELSDEPLIVRPDTVKAIRFDPAIDDKLAVPDQEIQLSNGDAIPCQIESMDDKTIYVSTWYAGKLEIPRAFVAAVHCGISKPRPILGRLKALRNWSESSAWEIDADQSTFTSSGTGRIIRQLDSPLPERFVIRFHYRWKGAPNIRFHFAADQFEEGASNRYILTINSAGIEVKRQSSRGRTYSTLSASRNSPENVWPDGMDVELRIDRSPKEPLFLLFVNGELVDRFVDTVMSPPSDRGLMFESGAGGRSGNVVSNFEILEWDGDSMNRRKREENTVESDTVYDRQGEYFSGRAEGISMHEGRRVIVFKHPHATEPLRIPLDQTASLWLHQPDPAPEIPETRRVLGLVDNGLLHIESLIMDERRSECTHPLLGKLTIDRHAVSSIESGNKHQGS